MVTSVTTSTLAREKRLITMVWAPHEGRTAMYAKRLESPLYNIHYLLHKRPFIAPIKYIAQALKTWYILLRERPHVIYVTNPPVFAPLCVYVYCKLSGAKFIMDTHPPALYSRRWGWTLPLQRWLAKRAHINVIDQQRFADLIESWGARAVVLTNPPKNPLLGSLQKTDDGGMFHVAVVNTFATDEPLDIILEAAQQMPKVHFHIMGDLGLAPSGVVERAPVNVTFTGYLRGDAYWNCLYNARAVMVLTTYPYSLLGGAQDGVTLDKPLILSDQPALREYFTGGTVFVENTTEGIIDGVKRVMESETALIEEVKTMAQEQNARWESNFRILLDAIVSA